MTRQRTKDPEEIVQLVDINGVLELNGMGDDRRAPWQLEQRSITCKLGEVDGGMFALFSSASSMLL